jgi:hypothetical protein
LSQLGQPTPTGGTVSGGATAAKTGTSTTTSGNLLSTIVGAITHHSDARRVQAMAFSLPFASVVGSAVAALSFGGGLLLILG